VRVLDEELAPAQLPGRAALEHDGVGIERSALLDQREARDPLAGRQRREQALLLGGAAGREHERRRHDGARHERPGEPGAAHLLDEQDDVDQRAVAAAELGRDQETGPPQLGHASPQRFLETALVEGQALHELGRTVLAQERARRRRQDLLGRRQAKIHLSVSTRRRPSARP
jgi:hypothetical protein